MYVLHTINSVGGRIKHNAVGCTLTHTQHEIQMRFSILKIEFQEFIMMSVSYIVYHSISVAEQAAWREGQKVIFLQVD